MLLTAVLFVTTLLGTGKGCYAQGDGPAATKKDFLDAVSLGRTPQVQATLDKNPAWVNASRLEGASRDERTAPLFYAVTAMGREASAKRLELVQLLLDRGADPNFSGGTYVFTPLIAAIHHGDNAVVQLLLDHGADPGVQDGSGKIPLWHAMQEAANNPQDTERGTILQTLLQSADTNAWDKEGRSALHIALENPSVTASLIDPLLQRHANLEIGLHTDYTQDTNPMKQRGLTPLHMAAGQGNAEVVKLLLDRGAKINSRTTGGDTPLHCAAREGKPVLELLLSYGADASAVNASGETPLLAALHEGHAAPANIKLLASKTDLTQRDRFGFTPLTIAVLNGDKAARDILSTATAASATRIRYPDKLDDFLDAVSQSHLTRMSTLLKERPFLVTERLPNGWTALHVAALWAAKDAMRVLLENGASVDARDGQGATPLLRLLNAPNATPESLPVRREIARLLIDKGADVNAFAAMERQETRRAFTVSAPLGTPFLRAIANGDAELVTLFLTKGASLRYGSNAALMLALRNDKVEIAQQLLKAGADINTGSTSAESPLTLAFRMNRLDLVKQFVEAGADVNSANDTQKPLIFLAVATGDIELVKLFVAHKADLSLRDYLGDNLLGTVGTSGLKRISPETATAMIDYLKQQGLQEAPRQMRFLAPEIKTFFADVQNGNVSAVKDQLARNPKLVEAIGERGTTPLQFVVGLGSARQKNLDVIVSLLLENGAPLEARDGSGATPLITGASGIPEDYDDVFAMLLAKGANPKAADKSGVTALHRVTNAERAKLLIEKGADVNATTKEGATPLHWARPDVVPLLLAAGANANARDMQGNIPLQSRLYGQGGSLPDELIAASNLDATDSKGFTPVAATLVGGNREVREALMENEQVKDESTLFCDAAAMSDPAKLEAMLHRKPELIFTRLPDGTTPLHLAVQWLAPDCVQLLLARGAAVNARDSRGRTPLMLLLRPRSAVAMPMVREVVGMLLAKGADVNAADSTGRTPLVQAMRMNNREIIQLLLDNKANPDLPAESNYTALALASSEKELQSAVPDIVDMLLQKGASIDMPGNVGYGRSPGGSTPLMIAIRTASEGRNNRMFATLIEKGASLIARDDAGNTPLAVAAMVGNNEAVTLLLRKGAPANPRNYEGKTPLGLARAKGYKDIAKQLEMKGGVE